MQRYFEQKASDQKKRARTRSVLVDATIDVIAEKGSDGATVRDVTGRVGMSPGTFYNHFQDMDDAVRSATLCIIEEVIEGIIADLAGVQNASHRVVIATYQTIAAAVDQPHWGVLIVTAFEKQPDLAQDFAVYLREDVNQGIEQKHFTVENTSLLIDQLAALILLAIKSQLRVKPDKVVHRQTCEAMLRLLGQSPAKAAKTVAAALSR